MKSSNVYKITARAALVWAVLAILLAGCEAPSIEPTTKPTEADLPVTPTPYIARLEVFPGEPLQTIRDVGGGNFIHRYGGTNSPLDPVSRLNIKTLSPTMARVSIDLDLWEPENDNVSSDELNWDGFKDEPGTIVRDTFEFMQTFQKIGDAQILIGSVWYVPDWMVENPEDNNARRIPPELVPEVIESLVAWILHAREAYGVEIDYVSFNEANLGINVLLNADDYIPLILQAGERFTSSGIQTRWLLGDSSNAKEAKSYASAIYAEPAIRQYLGPLAFHSWDATTGDQSLSDIAKFASDNNLEVWCTEGGWNPSLWQTPDFFPTFTNALNQAIVYTRVLKMTGATSLLYWEMMGGDYSLNNGTEPYPILSFMAEMKKHFPPGAQIIQTSEDAQNLKFTAVSSRDDFTLLFVNRLVLPEDTTIKGLPDGVYYLVRSTKEVMNQLVETYEVKGGTLMLSVAASSINFLTTRQP
jgi:O-glycosyl hydrolase